ncbi:Uncharacterized protein DAT39_001647, partial [Clarias magur]
MRVGNGPLPCSQKLIRAVQQRGVEGGRREAQSAEAWLCTDYLPLSSSRLHKAERERGDRHELNAAHNTVQKRRLLVCWENCFPHTELTYFQIPCPLIS